MPETSKKEGNIYFNFSNKKINIQKNKAIVYFTEHQRQKDVLTTQNNIIEVKVLSLLWVIIFGKLVLLSDVLFILYFPSCLIRYSPSLFSLTNNEGFKMSSSNKHR